jgi:hypothetical protein
MWVETWFVPIIGVGGAVVEIFSVLRLLRLLRLVRIVRVLRQFPELVSLVKGIAAGLRGVASSIVILVIILYVFAIIFSQGLYGHTDPTIDKEFGTVPNAMLMLFMLGTLNDEMRT